jgi:hypothetical protein
MRRKRTASAVTLGILAVAYATWTLDGHLEGRWESTRLDGLVLAGLTLAAVLVIAPWLWRPPQETLRPSAIASARLPHTRAAGPVRPYQPPPAALVETTQVIPGAVKRAAWDAARAGVEVVGSAVAVTEVSDEPSSGPMDPLELHTYLEREIEQWRREDEGGRS